MEKYDRRVDYSLDDHFHCRIATAHWIFDLRHYCRFCLRSTGRVAHSGFSDRCRVNFLFLYIANSLTKLRGTPCCQRQALCSSNFDIKARWPEVTCHDPPLSITIFSVERSHVDLSFRPSGNVRSCDGDSYTEAPSSRLHW